MSRFSSIRDRANQVPASVISPADRGDPIMRAINGSPFGRGVFLRNGPALRAVLRGLRVAGMGPVEILAWLQIIVALLDVVGPSIQRIIDYILDRWQSEQDPNLIDVEEARAATSSVQERMSATPEAEAGPTGVQSVRGRQGKARLVKPEPNPEAKVKEAERIEKGRKIARQGRAAHEEAMREKRAAEKANEPE